MQRWRPGREGPPTSWKSMCKWCEGRRVHILVLYIQLGATTWNAEGKWFGIGRSAEMKINIYGLQSLIPVYSNFVRIVRVGILYYCRADLSKSFYWKKLIPLFRAHDAKITVVRRNVRPWHTERRSRTRQLVVFSAGSDSSSSWLSYFSANNRYPRFILHVHTLKSS